MRFLVFISMLFLSPIFPLQALTPESQNIHLPAQKISGVLGLENFAKMNPNFYRGAQPSNEGYRQLKAMGIKTVINLRLLHSYRSVVEPLGLNYFEIPLQAGIFGSEAPTEDQVRQFFSIVLNPTLQPVFIHCSYGKDRTGTMAALYRIEVDHWTPEEAIQEMQDFGYHDIYRDLIEYVRRYSPRGFVEKLQK